MAQLIRKQKLWTIEVKLIQQDEILKHILENQDLQTWTQISKAFFEISGVMRSSKQCRDRWNNNLQSEKNFNPWQENELKTLFNSQRIHGNQWSLIAREMNGRSENQIKNFFYSTIRRNIRKFNKGKLDSERIRFKSLSILDNEEIRSILTTKKSISKNYFLSTFLSEQAVKIIQSQFLQTNENAEVHYNSNFLMPPEMKFTSEDFYISDDSGSSSNPNFEDDKLLDEDPYTLLEFSDILDNQFH